MTQYRSVTIDGVSCPTTAAGATAIELLQSKLRDARNEIEGLQGQLDAIRSMSDRAAPANDGRHAAADAHAEMVGRLNDAWKGGRRAG